MAALPKIETSIKFLSPFNVPVVLSKKASFFWPYNLKRVLVTPPIATSYSCEQLFSLLPMVVYYIILSSLLECLEFPIETTSEVSISCRLNLSYEDKINVYSFIARVERQLAQASLK